MNKILIFLLIIIIWIPVFTGMTRGQGSENITFRALNSSGQPITGQAGNIQVKDLNGNIISSTVTEVGTQGNYIISFPPGTSWQLGKVYLNSVFQQFIGIHWVGDPETIFPTLMGSQAFTGQNLFYNIQLNGSMNANNHYIQNLLDPVNNQDAATKGWVLSNVGGGTGNLYGYCYKDSAESISKQWIFYPYPPVLEKFFPNESYGAYRYGPADSMLAANKWYVDSVSSHNLLTSNNVWSGSQIWNNNITSNANANFTQGIKYIGTDINTGGALSNVAYLNYANIGNLNCTGYLAFDSAQALTLTPFGLDFNINNNKAGGNMINNLTWTSSLHGNKMPFYSWQVNHNATGEIWMGLDTNGLNVTKGVTAKSLTLPTVILNTTGNSTVTVDWSAGNNFEITINQNAHIAFTKQADGKTISMAIINQGAYTISFPTMLWPGGTLPTITTNGTDVITCIDINGNLYANIVQNMK